MDLVMLFTITVSSLSISKLKLSLWLSKYHNMKILRA